MELRILTAEDVVNYRDRILEMMRESDNDFVPPLSVRFSNSQTVFVGGDTTGAGIESYYKSLVKEKILGAFEGDHLLGFISYKENLVNAVYDETTLPNIYLATLIVSRAARGKRLTQTLYAHLFNDLYPERNIFTRTWSTNDAHTHILFGFGFEEMLRMPDDRGPGIDTVHYRKLRG